MVVQFESQDYCKFSFEYLAKSLCLLDYSVSWKSVFWGSFVNSTNFLWPSKQTEGCTMLYNRIVQPLCLGQLLKYFRENEEMAIPTTHAYLYAMGVVLGSAFSMMSHHLNFFTCQHMGMQIRVATCSLIYRKVLHTSTLYTRLLYNI